MSAGTAAEDVIPERSRDPAEDAGRSHEEVAPDAGPAHVVGASADAAVDERALARAFRAGDRSALATAFRTWGDLVLALARSAVGRDDAEDVAQQVFVQAWRSREGFDPDRGELPGWLVGITRNVARQHHARRSSARRLALVDDVAAQPDDGPGDEVADALLVADALRRLPDDQREALELGFLDDMTQAEVAERLSLPLGTVKSRQRRGLRRLRRVVEDQS